MTDETWETPQARTIVEYVSKQAYGNSNLVNTKLGKIVIMRVADQLISAYNRGYEDAKQN